MTATTAVQSFNVKFSDPAWYAFMLLRIILGVTFIVTGLDKFFNLLTYWPKYLAPIVNETAPLGGEMFLQVVGVVEIMLGIVVLIIPRYGAPLVACWLAFIIANLLLIADYHDVAFRDFGMLISASALFLLSFHRQGITTVNEQEHDHA